MKQKKRSKKVKKKEIVPAIENVIKAKSSNKLDDIKVKLIMLRGELKQFNIDSHPNIQMHLSNVGNGISQMIQEIQKAVDELVRLESQPS